MKEFDLLASYVKFDQSLADKQKVPKTLTDLEVALSDPKANRLLISPGCVEAIRSAAGLDMQIDEMLLAYSN